MLGRTLVLSLCFVSTLSLAQVSRPHSGVTLVRRGGSALAVADLCAPGVSMRATKYGERRGRAQTWASRGDVNAQVAINADFFDLPGWTFVNGRAKGAGESWPADKQLREVRQYWQFGPRLAEVVQNAAQAPNPASTEIVGGHNLLIRDGRSQAPNFDGDAVITTSHRRTAIGISEDRRFIYLYATNNVFNGTQVVAELTSMAAQAGAPPIHNATNMDGGGSSQLYVQGLGQVVDSSREVNNHLGIIARGTGAATNCPLPPPKRDVVLRENGTSGWTLDAHGAIAPFGGAPQLGTPGERWNWEIARALVVRATGTGGYVLDGWGGIHAVGDAPAVSGGPYWQGNDIARSLVLRKDGVSGYVLDGLGGIHPFGGAPKPNGGPYWKDWDIARDLVLRDDGTSGYVLDGYGGIHAFGGAPAVAGGKYFGVDVARSLVLSYDGVSGYVVDHQGGVFGFGGAPAANVEPFGDGQVTALAIAPDGVSGVVLHQQSGTRPFRAAKIGRAVRLVGDEGEGYQLFGDGSIEAFGGATPISVPSTWTWDIARDFVLRTDGTSGWILDGWGGLHAFGGAPQPTTFAYWKGWDIARALAVTATSLHTLEGFGGLHAADGAAALTGGPYWKDWDIARDFVFRPGSGSQGYVLDGFGGVHAVGGAPAAGGGAYWPNRDVARALALNADGTAGWVLHGDGTVHPFNGAAKPPIAEASTRPGWLAFRTLDVRGDRGVTTDTYGRVFPFEFPSTPPAASGGGSGTSSEGGGNAPPAGGSSSSGGSAAGGSSTLPSEEEPPKGCGCDVSAGPAFALVALLVRRRRR